MYWFVFIALMLFSWIVQMMLESRFKKYSKIRIPLSGAEVSAAMLRDNGIDVKIQSVRGKLTDHYNPLDKTINLSEPVFSECNIAAAAVAAHETGHCIQHAHGYLPLRLRSALVPVVTFSNSVVMWVLLAGMLLIQIFPWLIWLGVALFAVTTLFSFITLPVEIDASRRAIEWLRSSGLADAATLPMAQDALKWAAYTYVIAALSSLATLFYYIGIARDR